MNMLKPTDRPGSPGIWALIDSIQANINFLAARWGMDLTPPEEEERDVFGEEWPDE